MTSTRPYEAVIGLEVHAQLLTQTKQFCGCATAYGAEPNTQVCPVCLGLPGALPVLNREAVAMAVRGALALQCSIRARSVFARKSYFYPDLPKGYQISQFDLPFSEHGYLEIPIAGGRDTKRVGVTRVHLEEDAGKNLHGVIAADGRSVVDLNRAGVPLIEIVGDPDLRSADEAVEYLKRLREILMALEINDGNLEEGSFRCDVNISVRPVGAKDFGTRVEVKNVNSFRHVHRAIEHELARLTALAEAGETFPQHTRQWDDAGQRTVFLRNKEGSDDYRYFPDPDLPPLELDDSWVAEQRRAIPELPERRRARLVRELHLAPYDAEVLTSHPRLADFFERVLAARPHEGSWAKRAANFVMSELLADVAYRGLEAKFPVSPAQLSELLALVDDGSISGKQAKELYAAVVRLGPEASPASVARERGMAQVNDVELLERVCAAAIAASPKQAAAYRAGKTGTIGFFVGQVMRETNGSANPAVVNELLQRLLMGGT